MTALTSVTRSTWNDRISGGTLMASEQKRTAVDFPGLYQQKMCRIEFWNGVFIH